MTGADDVLLRWCMRAGEGLAVAADRVGELAAAIAADWLDDHGREWAERTRRVRRDLGAASADAAAAGRLLTSTDDPHDAEGEGSGRLDPAVLVALLAAADRRDTGPRLGGTDGLRIDGARGVSLAQLPDEVTG